MKLKKLNWPLIVLVAALLSLAGCKSDSDLGASGSIGGDTLVFDADGDGIPDNEDSCRDTRNSGVDQDADGIDDACDTDIAASSDLDGDTILNVEDNCPLVKNAGQKNTDKDLFGDACDTDADGDGIADKTKVNDTTYEPIAPPVGDNCPLISNAVQGDQPQVDSDGDNIGDPCDTDADGDTVPDKVEVSDTNYKDLAPADGGDNCPLVPNTDQADADFNNVGDACEGDGDGDGIPDGVDNCPAVPNPGQEDLDGDLIGDACDGDTDGDGVNDENLLGQPLDNCRFVQNPGQEDVDGDGIGDACDLVNDIDYACGVDGQDFTPMLASDSDIVADASSNVSGCLLPGLLCGVIGEDNVIDDDLSNAATLQNTDLLGLSTVTLRVAATSGFAYPGVNAVGVAFNESAGLLQFDLLGGSLIVRTKLNGVVQEESNGDLSVDLDLLGASGLLGGTETSFLVFQTSERFDSVEVEFAPSVVSLLNEVNVLSVCASKTDIVLP